MRIGSLCSGYGGLDLAVEEVFGARVEWFAENDPHPATVYRRHWPDAKNHGDITTTDWSRVAPVDIITAGYPCTPFSLAGQRTGHDHDAHLWPNVREAIGHLRPTCVVLENVAAHLSLGFDVVAGDLAHLGYDAQWGVVHASDAGAAHRRARLFVVATTTDTRGEAVRLRPGLCASRPPEVGGGRPDYDGDADCPRCAGTVSWDWWCGDCGCPAYATPARFGHYTDAVARWEFATERPAPPLTDMGPEGGVRLNARFVEWLMGLPAGWVTQPADGGPVGDLFGGWKSDVGVPRAAQLKMLGNGVVPQQAALALRLLLADEAVVA